MKKWIKITGLLLFALPVAVQAVVTNDPFVGAYSGWTLETDDNIEDGVTIVQLAGGYSTVSQTDATHYTMNLYSVSIDAERVGNRLQSARSIDTGDDWNVLDCIMLSDGTNRVFAMMGQESWDLLDISITVGSRSSYTGSVTLEDFVGTWSIDGYIDENLSDVSTGFEQQLAMLDIQRIDATHIRVTIPNEDPISLRVSGNQAYLESPVSTTRARYHAFRIRTDKQKMSIYAVGANLSDKTDVSLLVGLGVKLIPPVVITSPTPLLRTTNGAFAVRGTVISTQTVASVWGRVNSNDWMQASGTNSWSLPVTLAAGPNTIRAYCVDAAGNNSITSAVVCTYVVLGTLTVQTNGLGTVTRTPISMPEVGATYMLTATAGAGFAFTNWTGDATGTNRVVSFVMTTNMTIAANFKDLLKPTVAITAPTALQKVFGTAGDFVVRGTALDNFALSNVMVKVNSGPFVPASTTTNVWKNWSQPVTLTHGITNIIAAYSVDTAGNNSLITTVKCVYVETGTLTIQTNGAGTVTRAPTGAPEVGKTYTLTAAAGTGSVFLNWTGAVNNPTNKVTTFTMTSNMTIRANFTDNAKPTVAITAPTALQKVFGTNGDFTVRGTALDNLALSNVMVSVNSGSFVPASTTTNIWKNWSQPVTLTSGITNIIAAYSVDTTGNCSVTVTTKCVYTETGTLNISTNGPGKVTVTPTGPLLLGKIYTLTAAANAGGIFSNWTGDVLNPTNKVTTFTMTSNMTITANFTDVAKPTVTITAPLLNQRITDTNPVYTVKGAATDNSAVATVKVRLNSGDWTNAVTTNAWKSWSVPVTLTGGTNTILAYSMDTANNCSATSSVKCVYVETITLGDYCVLPLGAEWLYAGKGWDGDPSKLSNRVASVNYVITNFTGGVAARSYTTNCVRRFAAYLYPDPNAGETWDDYMASGGRFGFLGSDDIFTDPIQSIRVDGGLIFPDKMLIGSSAAKTVNMYDDGIFKGALSGKLQLIEKTSITVPAGTFPDVLHVRITFGTQVSDEWWARSVGKIKKKGVSGEGSKQDYELIQYSVPSASSISASSDPMGIPSSGQDIVPASTPQTAIVVDGSSKDWTGVPRSTFSYSSVTQEVASVVSGNNVALLLNGCPFNTSDTVLVYFKLRLTYGEGDNRHTVDLWTSGSVLYGMVDGQVITGLEAILLNGALEVKIPVEQAPSQVIIEEVGCGMDLGGGTPVELFRLTY